MIYLSIAELYNILKQVNNEGGKGKRLVDFGYKNNSASDSFLRQFVFAYDYGPQNATDNPWPQ